MDQRNRELREARRREEVRFRQGEGEFSQVFCFFSLLRSLDSDRGFYLFLFTSFFLFRRLLLFDCSLLLTLRFL